MERRTWGLRGALIALLAMLSFTVPWFGGGASVALAADGPQSVTFSCLGAPQYFSVPTGVTSITVSAKGASGRNGNNDSPGLGATIQGTMTVVPGDTYTISVGCTTSYGWANGGAGGDASTGLGSNGANGGGATGIVRDGTATPVLVAGGGGGSGGGGVLVAYTGGAGGNAGITAGNGSGGTGLGSAGGGAGGGSNGPEGVAGEEAHTSSSGGGGGGGGGGYTNGGARGGGGDAGGGGGGGGGAGMSFAAPALAGATIGTAAAAGDGSVTLSYTGPDGTPQIYRCTGAIVNYTVPAGVHTLLVVASGAQGGTIAKTTSAGAGGRGDVRVATIAVTSGETLQVAVGCVGGGGETGQHCDPGGGGGGFGLISGGRAGNGDGDCVGINGASGGSGGGGSSGITAGFPPDDTTDVLLMAGGGGGGGGFSLYWSGGNGGGYGPYNPDETGRPQSSGSDGGGVTPACSGDAGGPGTDTGTILGAQGGPGGNATDFSTSGGGGGGGGGYPIGGGGGGGGIGICGGGGGASGGSLVGPGVQPLVVGPFRVLGTGNGLVMITPLFADPKAASATTVTVPVNPVYDGTPKGASAQTTGTGGVVIATPTVTYTGTGATSYGPSTTPPTNAGTYSASATFPGNDDYLGSSDSKPFTIAKASSTTTVTVANATYDGNPHGGTAAATGAGGLNQSLTISYSGRAGTIYGPSTTAPTNVGSYTASASYAGDANHTGSQDSKDYVINKASSTTTVTVANATYDGNPHGGTAAATGAGGLNQSLTVSYAGRNGTTYGPTATAPTNAGDYTASASYTGDTNHNASQDSKNFTIAKASSTTTVTVADATYDGNPHGGTAAVTGAGGLNQSLTISYSGRNGTTYGPSTTAPTNAGDYTASASFAGDANHTSSQDSKNFSIARAPSTTTVTATNITYTGSPYAGASASVTGAGGLNQAVTPITYTGRNGTTYGPSTTPPTNAGDYTASATYPGDANHTGSQDSKPFTIAKAPTTIGAVRGDMVYGDTTGTATATLRRSDNQSPVAGATITFTVGGAAACGGAGLPACPASNGQGVATLTGGRFPAGLNAGTQANVLVCAAFVGNTNYLPSGPVCSPLVVARRLLWVKASDRTVVLKQPNPSTIPPAGCQAQATDPTFAACGVELANGSTFVNGDDWRTLDLTLLRFQYARNPPSTNSVEKVGSTYRITAFGINVANYDIRYLSGIMTVVAAP